MSVILEHKLKNPASVSDNNDKWLSLADIEEIYDEMLDETSYELKIHGKLADENSVSVNNTIFKTAGYDQSVTAPDNNTYLSIAPSAVGKSELYIKYAGDPTKYNNAQTDLTKTISENICLPIVNNGITSNMIANEAITQNKIGGEVIVGGNRGIRIADGAIEDRHLSIGGINGEKIVQNTLPADRLNTKLKGIFISPSSPSEIFNKDKSYTFWNDTWIWNAEDDDWSTTIDSTCSHSFAVNIGLNYQNNPYDDGYFYIFPQITCYSRFYDQYGGIQSVSAIWNLISTNSSWSLTTWNDCKRILSKYYFKNIFKDFIAQLDQTIINYRLYVAENSNIDYNLTFELNGITSQLAEELAKSIFGLNEEENHILPDALHLWDKNETIWEEQQNPSYINWLLIRNQSQDDSTINDDSSFNTRDILYTKGQLEEMIISDEDYNKIGLWIEI